MPAKVFILIPAFNAGKFIRETIQSVLDQTYTDWELLVLDDASTDDTFSLANSFSQKDNRISVFRNETNLGMIPNWNLGISFCESEYFVKLDADDLWNPKMLEKSMSILERHKDVGLVFSKYINIDDQGKFLPNTDIIFPEFAQDKSFYCWSIVCEGPRKMLSYSILRQGLSVMRVSVFNRVGNYESYQSADTIFYFKIGCHYKIHCIDEVLYFYRIHKNSDSLRIEKEGVRQLLLYQIKFAIIKYYFQFRILSFIKYIYFIRLISFDFNLYTSVSLRKKSEHTKSIKLMLKNLICYPDLVFIFYFKRIIERQSTRDI